MRKDKLLLKEETNRLLEMAGVNPVSNKHLAVVDIQPEYQSGFSHFLSDFVNFLNENHSSMSRITFFYNGADTLGMISESDLKMWWYDNGLDEEVIENAIFYDKGYAFFRYCIDSGIDDSAIVNLVKFMIQNNINDSRELTKVFWNKFVKQYGDKDIRTLLETADDMINIPDLMDELQRYNNVVVCGGGINECLKEVEIALDALGKPYNVLTKYTY